MRRGAALKTGPLFPKDGGRGLPPQLGKIRGRLREGVRGRLHWRHAEQ
jgi:hypothetical protein